MLGASIGSFMTLVATRMDPSKEPKSFKAIFVSPSHCNQTGKKLAFWELIPIFSFIFLRGRSARDKRYKIPTSYLVMEVISGLAALILYIHIGFGNIPLLILYSVLTFSFIYLSYYDYLYWEVQLGIIIFNFLLVLFYYLFLIFSGTGSWQLLINKLLASVFGIGFIVFFIIISKGKGLGLGDAWIMGVMGMVLGFMELFIALTIASVVGSIFGLFKAYFVSRKVRGVMIQFVPFLSLGFILTLLFGKLILEYVYY